MNNPASSKQGIKNVLRSKRQGITPELCNKIRKLHIANISAS